MFAAVSEVVKERKQEPAVQIAELMHQRIQSYLHARSDPSVYQSLRNMSEIVSDDYGNRFLIELIQNAHDANDSARSDGEIEIVLDPTDGPHGCLYVANRGVGFVWDNVKAICNIALSSKPVNAGIGNKGLGFRSVLQICTWPEIFSVHGTAGRGVFDGYCFRFATEDDLRNALGTDATDASNEMAANIPCWHIPVPLESSHKVAQFAAAGFATVARLPLKSDEALSIVRTEIDRLLQLQTPLHLFLNRVGCITIARDGTDRVRLERTVKKSWSVQSEGWEADFPIEYSRVQLGQKEFLLAEWNIDEAAFLEALDTSLTKRQIPEAWRKWEGSARVSVAVPLGETLDCGTLYCFLPLGHEGKAPFAGYINANFYTKMDRRTVDTDIWLNNYFLQMAAWVSCQAVTFLVEQDWRESPAAVVSLLCWDDKYLEAIRRGLGDNGDGILKRPLLPVRGPGGSVAWSPAALTIEWIAPPNAWLSTKRLYDVVGASVLFDALTPKQRIELNHLYQRLRGVGFAPAPEVIADWVEKIAIQAHADRVPGEQWGAFYDEIAQVLEEHPQLLFGKRFLLSVNGELIRSERPTSPRGRRTSDVYFAPDVSTDADADNNEGERALPLETMPARLRSGFALLSREVAWTTEGGQRKGRLFLVAGKLVREYDTGEVLRTLASVTRSDVADSTRQHALEWAFRLWNRPRSVSEKETRAAQFYVHSVGGWLPAEAAMLGESWNVGNGKQLETFLRHTEGYSKDLENVRARLLPPFEQWPIRHGDEGDWIRFLTAAGVSDCLRPIGGEKLETERSSQPHPLASTLAGLVAGMDESFRAAWRDQMLRASGQLYGSRTYRSELAPWRLPGQYEAAKFPDELRREYAVQVVQSINKLNPEHLQFRVVRAGVGAVTSEVHRWPTPLHTFLTNAAWLPVVRQGAPYSFVPPAQAWLFVEDDERAPRFIDLISPQVAAAINEPTKQWLCDHASLGIFNQDKYAGRAISAMAAAAAHGISELRDVRRFAELFRRLWTRVQDLEQTPTSATCIPVRRGGAITAIHRDDEEIASAYFDDQHDPLRTQLLEEIGVAVFDFVPADPSGSWKWVNATVPGRFKRISSETLEVFLDGIQFDEAVPRPLLTDLLGAWIVDFLVCVAEHKSGSFVKATQNVLGRLRRTAMSIEVAFATDIQIANDDQRLPLPPSLRDAIALPTSRGTVLIVQASQPDFNLDLLASLAVHIAAALSMREMANGLEAALLRLAKLHSDEQHGSPGDETVAAALGVEVGAIKATRQLVSGDLIGMLHFALPLAACAATPDILDVLANLSNDEDPPHDAVHAALDALATAMGMPLATLEERMASVNDMRDLTVVFDLPIASLNAAIAKMGGVYKEVSNEVQHLEAWKRYLRLQMTAIVNQIRHCSAGLFDRGEPLIAYVANRDAVLDIAPDPAWFTLYDELPETVMAQRVKQWFEEQVPDNSSETSLDVPVSECRTMNGARLRNFWDRFGPVLSAWVRAHASGLSGDIRQAWMDPTLTLETHVARARDHGWLDFRPLDDAAIAKWLTADGIWPTGQPVDSDAQAWGVTLDAVLTGAERAQQERAELQKRRSEISFAGHVYSGYKDAYGDIADAVAAAIENAPFLSKVTSTDTALNEISSSHPSGTLGGGSGGRGTSKPPETEMSDVQKQAIGLFGELWAREWIGRRHGFVIVDESMWVSRYRDVVLDVSGGSDMLGYDFVVAMKNTTYYYEVKASIGNPHRFEMGPTEIGAAQRYRGDREHRYRILYVSHAGDPARTHVSILPNPFSVKGSRKFKSVGKGSVTYEFDPA